jgi:hypothetical protein
MSWFKSAVGAVAVLALAGTTACGGSSSSSSNTTSPSAVTYTDVFTGTVQPIPAGADYGQDNGNHFTVHQAGNLSVSITKLSPLSTITVGLGIGVYDAGSASCAIQLTSDAAKLNLVLSASVSIPGELCVGIYDVGNLSGPSDYEVTITHT